MPSTPCQKVELEVTSVIGHTPVSSGGTAEEEK
jgi:hypothetical protein